MVACREAKRKKVTECERLTEKKGADVAKKKKKKMGPTETREHAGQREK